MASRTPKTPTKLHPIDEVKQMINRLEDKVDKRLDKVETKVDRISESTIRNTSSLEEHMRRSDQLEKRNDMLKEELDHQRSELTKMSTAVLEAIAPKEDKGMWHKAKHLFKMLHEVRWIIAIVLGSSGGGAAILHWLLKVF